MNRFLRPKLYAARAGRDIVLLDIRSGRYELIAGAGERLSIDETGRRLDLADPEVDLTLGEADMFVSEAGFEAGPPLPSLPTRSVIGTTFQPQWSDKLRFAAAWGEMVGHYYGRDLPALLQRVGNSLSASEPSSPKIERLARSFHHLSPWAPFSGDCVFRCFMLLCALKRVGASDVRWVFGVRTWPFYAHCWLQRGEVTLTDYAEPLVSFVPIFATGQ